MQASHSLAAAFFLFATFLAAPWAPSFAQDRPDSGKLHVGLPQYSVTPSSLDFGRQSMGTTSQRREVTISAGSALFPYGTASATPSTSDAQFRIVSHNCASFAMPGSCTVEIAFTPSPTAGALNGTREVAGTLYVLGPCSVGGYFTCPPTTELKGTAERSLLTHYYGSILGRAPDAEGRQYWEGRILRTATMGMSLNEAWYALAATFFSSAEYLARKRSDIGFIGDLYLTFFGREPDGAGRDYWTGQLASGLPREIALASFMFSAEFISFTRGVFGSGIARPDIDTVADFYRGLLGRLPDDAGFAEWLALFRSAQCRGQGDLYAQVDAISSAFAGSPEYAARSRTHAQYVGDLYNAFLRRGGDLAGARYWIAELESGRRGREDVRRAFLASPEFSSRLAAVLSQGCQL